jgi:hypothetical protein
VNGLALHTTNQFNREAGGLQSNRSALPGACITICSCCRRSAHTARSLCTACCTPLIHSLSAALPSAWDSAAPAPALLLGVLRGEGTALPRSAVTEEVDGRACSESEAALTTTDRWEGGLEEAEAEAEAEAEVEW